MTTTTKAALFALAGLAAGWVASSAGRPRENAKPALAGASRTMATSRPAPRRPADRPAALMDVAACRAVLDSGPDGRHPLLHRFAREQALRRWLELDAPGAFAEAAKDPEADFARELFEAWAEVDPRAALDALNAAGRRLTRSVARDFFIALMNRDPGMAAAELARPMWKDGKEDQLGWRFHADVMRQWMRADPATAIASFGPPGSMRSFNSGERAMAAAWAEEDFPATWAHFTAKGFGDDGLAGNDALRLLAIGLLKGDRGVVDFESRIAGIEGLDSRHRDRTIASAMVESNPRAALDWAATRATGDPLRRAIEAKAAPDLASSDPAAALAFWEGAGAWDKEDFLRESFAALAAEDPADAAARMGGLDESDRVPAMGGVLTRVFADDPAAAVARCQTWLDDPELRPAVARAWALAFSWAHGSGGRDPGPMLEAIPELHDAVDSDVLSTWTKVDPEAAAGWIRDRLEQGHDVEFSGEFREKGILTDLATSRPEFTATWLQGLPDPGMRAAAADALAVHWAAFDPAAADAWIATLPAGPVRDAALKGRAGPAAAAGDHDPFR